MAIINAKEKYNEEVKKPHSIITGFFVIISARRETEIRIIKIAINPDIEERVGLNFFRRSRVRDLRKTVFRSPARIKGITMRKKRFFIRMGREK
jgi:hypothetical protein